MFRIVQIIISVIGVVAGPSVAPPDTSSEASTVSIELHDGTDPRWIDDITEDLTRFSDAGLDPFSADIHVWDSSRGADRCHDHAGYFSNSSTGPRVDLCIDYHDTELGTHLRHKLVLHELAHAWIHTHVTDSTRAEFTASRDIDTWNDPATYHPARGTEIAANIVMSALHPDDPPTMDSLCGYELITGQPTPFGRTDTCSNEPAMDDFGIHGADAETAELIERSVSRYVESGLELPDLVFHVHHDGRGACDGHRGYWQPGRHTDRIDVCSPTESLILHEIAHAWEHHFVDDDTRDAFMALFPGEEWRDEGVGHFAQGIERFAEAVAWGLKSHPIPADNVDALQERIDLFEMITGTPTLRLAS